MASVLVNEPKTLMLDERLAAPPFDDLELGLFKGATVPDVDTVLGDLDEQDGDGYARVPIENWSPAVLELDGHAVSLADEITFTNSGVTDWDETTGWFWYNPTAALLVMAGRFSIPFSLPPAEEYPTIPVHRLTGE